MSSNRDTDLGKPSKYVRDDNPELSALLQEIEGKHTAITSPKRIFIKGHHLVVEPGVFNPEFSLIGDLLVNTINILPNEVVLDLGTGTGFQAIVASERAKHVIAIDKQLEAVECARKNVAMNRLEAKIEVRHGDLFSCIAPAETFDVIVSNFPFSPWKPKTRWQEANFDEGHQLLRQFLNQAKSHLSPGGRIGMTWSDLGDTDHFHDLLGKERYSYRILVERKVKGAGQYVYELKP